MNSWVLDAWFTKMLRPVDDVLADVINADLAAIFVCFRARVPHTCSRHEGSTTAGGLSETKLTSGVNNDADACGINTEFFHSNLQCNSVNALTHLCPSVTNFDEAVSTEVNCCTSNLAESISKAGVLKAETKPHSFSCSNRCVVLVFDCVETCLGSETTIVHDLARTPYFTRMNHVALTNLPARDSCHLSKAIKTPFHCELSLVCAESSECTTHRVVSANSNRRNIN